MSLEITYGDWAAITDPWTVGSDEYALMRRTVTTSESEWDTTWDGVSGDPTPPVESVTETETYEYSVFTKATDPEGTEYWSNLDDEDVSLALVCEKLIVEFGP